MMIHLVNRLAQFLMVRQEAPRAPIEEPDETIPVRVTITPSRARSSDRVVADITNIFARSGIHVSVKMRKRHPCGAIEIMISTPISGGFIGKIHKIEGVTCVQHLYAQSP